MIKNKEEQIHYINKIKPFINLKAVCEDYNRLNNSPIDYNNLRAVLNGVSKTRLSEEKLTSFINYLYQHLYAEVFNVYEAAPNIRQSSIDNIVTTYASKMSEAIIKEINNNGI